MTRGRTVRFGGEGGGFKPATEGLDEVDGGYELQGAGGDFSGSG